ncbi:transcriptional regulator [Amycolatopsis acidicola]|uniref:Transcriptional regulator n=1 Tax=Amycolatopsis acidicola TaxID=2596893 RepID=A0A5N0V3T3_9PSEU|nr:transcriptional regulator [Amycolatopsis acidicola]KAA9161046.1 transcriptional regulator [Amycolatopsis acidicola]
MSDEVLDWVERVSVFLAEQYGQPPIAGRILGWLMICDPPEQSAARIGAAIGASRASLTTNMRLLVGAGLVSKRTGRGERTTYFRMESDAWERMIRRRIESLASFRQITQRGLELAGPDQERLLDADRAFGFMERIFDQKDQRDA